ncbi:TolC family protein [Pleurocapsa sp. PCC 7319]|uniref:TolC family protein n=1 Tax=Pleurocapsa sp. PCC 7319 TaxID=118161 RepID=UPI00034CFFF5|nr:TolC family protein [Pleurocapsa sp. PCC 7319]
MGKKNQFVKAVSISTAVLLSNATLALAQNLAYSSTNANQTSDKSDIINNLKLEKNKTSKFISAASISASAAKLPLTIRDEKQYRQSSDFSQDSLSSVQVAQSGDPTEDIIKPAQQPITNPETLNPSGNPLSFPTQGDEVQVDNQKLISLEQAIELSLKNNKDIEDARTQVERAEAGLRVARAALFPTLDFNSGLSYSNDAFLDSIIEQNIDEREEDLLEATPGLSEEEARSAAEDQFTNSNSDSFTFTTGVTLDYNIYDGGNRGASIRTAEKQLRSTELDLETIVEQTRFETASDYYDLQDSDAQVKIEEAAVEDALQTLKDAQLLEQAGLGTRFDVLRAEVELAQARQRLSTAEANQNIARRQLAETLSVSHNAELATADAVEEAGTWEMPLPETIVQAFKNRAELEQLLLQREIGNEQRTIALSQIRPRVNATASYDLNDDFQDDFDINDQYSVGVNLQWRLFDGGAARASAEQAEKDIESAETQFADQRNQIRFAVEQAFFGLQANKRNISTATKEVELAEESLRLARLRFQAGVGTQTDVIDAQTQLTTARGSLLSSIIQYNQSYVDLQRQVSNTPDNGLQDLP